MVMPNGPEMAAAFVAVASWAAAAPLNAGYRADEFDFYLGDLDAKALIIQGGAGFSGARHRRAAQDPGHRADRRRERPGRRLHAVRAVRGCRSRAARLPTTSPWCCTPPAPPRGRRSCRCATAISPPRRATSRRRLALTPQDRCLVIMPLFHIHGLIGALLSSLSAGASVHCPPGFNALKFFGWLDQAEATWYTAVPTMHQTILARADRNADVIARRKLRFIRSSSASLPPQVMKQLEETFGCPVIESYGMTEASHQMASNPLPPRPRKPGTVGIAAGPEVAIMDLDGKLLPTRRDRRDRDPRRERDGRLRQQPESQCGSLHQRLVPHRRSGRAGRGRLSQPHRPAEGDHQSRRRKDRAARSGRCADGSPGGGAGRHLRACRTTSWAKRWPPRSCCAKARARPNRSCAPSPRTRLADFKVPTQDRVPAGDPEGRHRQAATHRPGRRRRLGLGRQ